MNIKLIDIPSKLEKHVHFQDSLRFLEQDNYLSVFQALKELLGIHPDSYFTVAKCLSNFPTYLPRNYDPFLSLMIKVYSDNSLSNNFFSILTPSLISDNPKVARELTIREMIKKSDVRNLLDERSLKDTAHFYADLFDDFQDNMMYSLDYSWKNKIGQFFEKLKQNPELFMNGWEVGTIGYIIKYDLVDSLCEMVSQGFDIFAEIEWSLYEKNPFTYFVSALDIAAFYGSNRVFKYLLSCGIRVSDDLFQIALYGGNHEILHILDNTGNIRTSTINSIIMRGDYELLDWVLSNTKDLVIKPIDFLGHFSYRTLIFSLLTEDFEMDSKLIHHVSSIGDKRLFKYLILKGYDQNSCDLNFLILFV